MKKSLSILALSIAMFTISCGPSAEDKAKRDKFVTDSINQDAMMMELEAQKAQAIQDSLATIEKMKTDSELYNF